MFKFAADFLPGEPIALALKGIELGYALRKVMDSDGYRTKDQAGNEQE
jgi:hypothetical protein